MTDCLTGGGQAVPRRVPLAKVERLLGLYREKYFDLKVRHFREKLVQEHCLGWSYTWVKNVPGWNMVSPFGLPGTFSGPPSR